MVRGKVAPRAAPVKKAAASTSRKSGNISVSSPAPNETLKKKTDTLLNSCSGCGIDITDDIKALQCDKCQGDQWKCADCLGISSSVVYEQLMADSRNNLCWFCEDCDKVIMSNTPAGTAPHCDKIDKLVIPVETGWEVSRCTWPATWKVWP